MEREEWEDGMKLSDLVKPRDGVRCLAEIYLLVMVWLHSHWSVAMVLSLLTVAEEVNTLFVRSQTEVDKALADYVRINR
jgi:hypothetical protein